MSVIIAIDPSCNSSGVCILPVDSKAPSAYECIVPPITDHNRLRYNYTRFSAIFNSHPMIRCIAFEKQVPQMRYNTSSANILDLAENIGVLKLAITERIAIQPDILVLGIPPGDIKRYATGNYRATKEDMIASVNGTHIKRIKREFPDNILDNVVDSYHLAKYVQELLKGDSYSKFIYYEKLSQSEL